VRVRREILVSPVRCTSQRTAEPVRWSLPRCGAHGSPPRSALCLPHRIHVSFAFRIVTLSLPFPPGVRLRCRLCRMRAVMEWSVALPRLSTGRFPLRPLLTSDLQRHLLDTHTAHPARIGQPARHCRRTCLPPIFLFGAFLMDHTESGGAANQRHSRVESQHTRSRAPTLMCRSPVVLERCRSRVRYRQE
jgi:hypothetical protein